ncbi:MAG: 4'-phosphopantetheinyl transferase superfamily protein [Chloroflexia bacterium]|nr:4'-phosphopantetheinyl transferase superfamily protein [Chloroflexia bacterium]
MSDRRCPSPALDEIHVWWIALDRRDDDAVAMLSPEERARADRFLRPLDRERWIAARAALRQILAGYTGSLPEDVRFVPPSPSALGEGGRGVRARSTKPALAGRSPVRFSLTHAGARAALAVTWERDVGIDLEPIDPEIDLPPLISIACTPPEPARLDALPPAARAHAFLTLWTLKEAYLKATGAGLSRDPRDICVELAPDGRVSVHDPRQQSDSQPWTLRLLDPGPGWIAAFAVAGTKPSLRELGWPRDP